MLSPVYASHVVLQAFLTLDWRCMSVSVDRWQEYPKRRNPALLVFLGHVPVVFVIALVTMRLFHTTTAIKEETL